MQDATPELADADLPADAEDAEAPDDDVDPAPPVPQSDDPTPKNATIPQEAL